MWLDSGTEGETRGWALPGLSQFGQVTSGPPDFNSPQYTLLLTMRSWTTRVLTALLTPLYSTTLVFTEPLSLEWTVIAYTSCYLCPCHLCLLGGPAYPTPHSLPSQTLLSGMATKSPENQIKLALRETDRCWTPTPSVPKLCLLELVAFLLFGSVRDIWVSCQWTSFLFFLHLVLLDSYSLQLIPLTSVSSSCPDISFCLSFFVSLE